MKNGIEIEREKEKKELILFINSRLVCFYFNTFKTQQNKKKTTK